MPHTRRAVTMADVAVRAGVSRSLVSLVVRESPLVSDERRALVLSAIDELGYRHNGIASRLAAKSTRTLGLLLFDLHNPVYADFHDGVVDVAEAAGFDVLLVAGATDEQRETELIDRLVALQVDALVLADYRGAAAALRRVAGGRPLVVANRLLDEPGVDTVMSDEAAGAALAVDHLVGLGHRAIAHLSSPPGIPDHQRSDGYSAAMRAHGLEPWIVPGDLMASGGRAAVSSFSARDGWPTAVIAHNDISAVGIVSALQEQGLSAPRDVSVVGYDDTELAALPAVSLTSVQRHVQAQGAAAAQMALDRLADRDRPRQTVVVAPRLVVRRSTGVPTTSRIAPHAASRTA